LPNNNDPDGGYGLDIVIGIFASSSVASVVDSTDSVYYNLTTTVWSNTPDGTLNVGNLNTRYDQRGAWWTYCINFGLTRGYYYLYTSVAYTVPYVTAVWPFETSPHYHAGGNIHLPSWACWWPDVILHEYAHHVMYSLYGFIPPALEEHYMTLRSDATTGWVEGWADFFPLAVFNKQNFVLGINATHGVSYNLEVPTWYSSGWDNGDQVEGHVAGALLDVFDSANDGYDTFSNGFTHIWNVLSSQTDNTFHEFWQAWCVGNYQRQATLMAIFQNSIDYRGLADVNGDGIVDVFDAILLANAMNTHRGDPGWDQRADLNYDDVIDTYDAVILSANFGHKYGC
jgi:Dockerin type I domain